MHTGSKFASLTLAAVLCAGTALPLSASTRPQKHTKKVQLPPPLPSGPQGPVPQVPLDSIPPIAPQVNYDKGQLTIVAPNSTLGDILRVVRKQTGADIDIPSGATERVVTHLGPGPAREVVAELLNGSHFNYVLLGSPSNTTSLTRVVLVPKSPTENAAPAVAGQQPAQPGQPGQPPANQEGAAAAMPDGSQPDQMDAEAPPEETPPAEDNADQNAAETDQPTPPADQPGIKTPQQLLQEMQQRQLQLQQQQQGNPGQPAPYPQQPPQQQ